MLHRQPKPYPSTLRLFSPDDLDIDDDRPIPPPSAPSPPTEAPPGFAAATLRQCFQQHILPELKESDRAITTIEEYESLLTHWEKYTENPPIQLVTKKTAKAFRTALIEKPYTRGKTKRKRSPATVNKIMRTLAACISPLWPADRHNPGGLGLLNFFDFPEPLPRQRKLPIVLSRKQMSALYLACDACRPKGGYRKSHLYDPRLWRAAIVLALNAGPRTWDLFRLRREDLRFEEFRHGSVSFVARKTFKDAHVPLNRATRIHLEFILSLNLHAERVFPGFKKGNAFYAAWKRICEKAGVLVDFEDFRKTCSTLHNEVIRGVGRFITGHSPRGVNDEYYDNKIKRARVAVQRLKLPREYVRGAKAIVTSKT